MRGVGFPIIGLDFCLFLSLLFVHSGGSSSVMSGRGKREVEGVFQFGLGLLIWAVLGRLNFCSWGSEFKKDGTR